jgi:alcohol dehydrogenase class IV
MSSIFTFPTRIVFGAGVRAGLREELARLGIHRPLVVTDPGVAGLAPVDALLAGLDAATVFQGVQANPAEADVAAGLARYREQACDGLVAIGGGSPIDAAKAIRLMATHPGELADYDITRGGIDRITANLPPLVAVPTTAGTGSEVGRGALIQLAATGRKTAILSPFLLPSVALCDPELTLDLPPALTAATGLDAFTHCVESFLSTVYHPPCAGIALEGLRHLARGLETAVRDGSDPQARHEVMMGALLGGISLHKGLGVVHALSHALGATGRVHHGTLNAILLPHALRYNLEAAEAAIAELGFQMGVGRGADGARHLITLVDLLLLRMPLPRRLGQLAELERGQIPHYARLAIQDHCLRTNPRPCDVAALEALLERAW